MGSHVLREAKRLRRPLDIPPHSLSRPVLFGVRAPGKYPVFPGVRPQIIQKRPRQIDALFLPGFLLRDEELGLELVRFEAQHVGNPQARV